MPSAHDPAETGERVEQLLSEIASIGDVEVQQRAEELVRALMEFYGAGLARIVELAEADPANGAALLQAMTSDQLVASLLALHDLHPQDVTERVQAALDQVRPYLGSHAGGVEFLGVDPDGVAHLRLEGSCEGCPSSTVTVKLAIERAIEEAAPELTGIHVEGVTEPTASEPKLIPVESLLPRRDAEPAGPSWSPVGGLAELRPGELRPFEVAGASVLVCHAGGQLYAYRNSCPACGSSLDVAQLADTVLACPSCNDGYDVRLAGRSTGSPDLHVEPLPLLADDDGVRIAVPAEAGR